MQVIILAAGRGTRMRELTQSTPKPLLALFGKPILSYIIENLPDCIIEVIVVIGYEGEKIKTHLEETFREKRITYIPIDVLGGTAHALFCAADILKETFLVLNGDDLYEKEDLEKLLRFPLAMGIKPIVHPPSRYLHVAMTPEKTIKEFQHQREDQATVNVCTGAYVLNPSIFSYSPVRINSGELSLPRTVLEMAENNSVHCVEMDHWFPLTTPEDIKKAEEHLLSHF